MPFYPDFLWLIYAAEAQAHYPDAMLREASNGVPEFLPLSDPTTDLLEHRLAFENRIFLAAALRHRAAAGSQGGHAG